MNENNKNIKIIAGLLLTSAILFFAVKKASGIEKNFLDTSGMLKNYPRGVKNNNPGNIRISYTNIWKGGILAINNTDGTFEQFKTYEHGVRALIKTLQSYYYNYKLNTIRKIISKYAPSNENDTILYINNVCRDVGISADKNIKNFDKEFIRKLVEAIIHQENGGNYLKYYQFEKAWKDL